MAHKFNYNTVVLSEDEYNELSNRPTRDGLMIDIMEILKDNYPNQLADDIIKCLLYNLKKV